jgi:apolipoprotein N-acyltransferase
LLGLGWSALLALAIGALTGAAAPAMFLVPIVAVLGCTLLLDGGSLRHGASVGYAFGLGWFAGWLSWMDVVGVDAKLGLVAFLALAMSAMGAGLVIVLPLRGGVVLAPTVWMLAELVRSSFPFGGFPWARLASGVEPAFPLQGALLLGGLSLAGAVIALVGTALARLVRVRRLSPRSAAITAAAVVLLLAVPPLAIPPVTADDDPATQGVAADTLRVALVQGSVPGEGLDFLGRRREVLNRHLAQTRILADELRTLPANERPALVVWPENASDIDPFIDAAARFEIGTVVKDLGIPLLLGAVVEVPGDRTKVRNTAILWDPQDGPSAVYVKQRPVPFGEFVPFRSLLDGVVGRLDRIPRDFVAGDTVGLINVAGAKVGIVFCFEVAADDVVRDTMGAGADTLVVLTNNATYSRTDQPAQQWAVTRLRAVEHRRSIAVAATTGITGSIDPTGRPVTTLPADRSGYAIVELPLGGPQTPATRAGGVVSAALAIVGLAACALGVRSRRRPVGPQPTTAADQPAPPTQQETT